MPHNGQVNEKFGVYKSFCCGAEIVINAGSEFPDCPNHPKLTTVWKPVADEKFLRLAEDKSASRALVEIHIENRRLFALAFGKCKLDDWELNHLHGCKVCQGVLYVFVHQPLGALSENPGKRGDAA